MIMITNEMHEELVEEITRNLEIKIYYKEAKSLIRKMYKKLIKYKYYKNHQSNTLVYDIYNTMIELENSIFIDFDDDATDYLQKIINDCIGSFYVLAVHDVEREWGINDNTNKERLPFNIPDGFPQTVEELVNYDEIYDFLYNNNKNDHNTMLRKLPSGESIMISKDGKCDPSYIGYDHTKELGINGLGLSDLELIRGIMPGRSPIGHIDTSYLP